MVLMQEVILFISAVFLSSFVTSRKEFGKVLRVSIRSALDKSGRRCKINVGPRMNDSVIV